ncbi:MAG: energy transducer TonB [Lentisphaerae bacterium]|nr:energy transducer TonB [Lentisphaerota bacterium]
MQPSREVSTYERPAPAWPWRLAVGTGALVLTALTALLVPLADLMSRGPQPSTVTYRTIELSPWQPPPAPQATPPPPPPPPAPPPPLQPRPIAPAPAPPAPTERLRLPLRLDFSLTPTRGEVALDFDPTPFAVTIPTESAPTPPAPPAPPPPEPPAKTAEPAELRDLDRAPEVVVQTRPVYPYRARAQRLEGHVDLRFTVTTDGRVVDVECLQAEPPHVFDDAAIAAVRRWTFSPGQRQGQPVAARMQIRIRFTLEEP